jgi:hypothetical protein
MRSEVGGWLRSSPMRTTQDNSVVHFNRGRSILSALGHNHAFIDDYVKTFERKSARRPKSGCAEI